MPIQRKYWNVMIHARKQQYFGQISAIAFLLRRYNTAISQKAWIIAKKSILWPITFTDRRKQVWKQSKETFTTSWLVNTAIRSYCGSWQNPQLGHGCIWLQNLCKPTSCSNINSHHSTQIPKFLVLFCLEQVSIRWYLQIQEGKSLVTIGGMWNI